MSSRKLPITIPEWIQSTKVKSFSGIVIETPVVKGDGSITKLDWNNNIRDIALTIPCGENAGVLVPCKSYNVLKIKVPDTQVSPDTAPFDKVQSLFENMFVEINEKAVCNNVEAYGLYHTTMANIHYDYNYTTNSSGWKVGCSLSQLAPNTEITLYMPFANPKYLEEEGILGKPLDLSAIKSCRIRYFLSQQLKNFLSSSDISKANITIEWEARLFIVHSNELKNNLGVAPRVMKYTRYAVQRFTEEANTTKLQHNFTNRYGNIKHILLFQRYYSTLATACEERLSNQFQLNSISTGNLYINGRPVYNREMNFSSMATIIDNLEKCFGRDITKALGAHFNITDSANKTKAFIALPLSADIKHSSGLNTKNDNKQLTFEADCNVVEKTEFLYVIVYEEIATLNPITKELTISQ